MSRAVQHMYPLPFVSMQLLLLCFVTVPFLPSLYVPARCTYTRTAAATTTALSLLFLAAPLSRVAMEPGKYIMALVMASDANK